jgi:hypothetical protein
VGAVLQKVISEFVTNLESQDTQTLQPAKPNITSMAASGFKGTLAGQQGSTAVEGLVFVAVRQDGVAAIVFTLNEQGKTGGLGEDYSAMLNSILTSM